MSKYQEGSLKKRQLSKQGIIRKTVMMVTTLTKAT
jgi:hypothetical protein